MTKVGGHLQGGAVSLLCVGYLRKDTGWAPGVLCENSRTNFSTSLSLGFPPIKRQKAISSVEEHVQRRKEQNGA